MMKFRISTCAAMLIALLASSLERASAQEEPEKAEPKVVEIRIEGNARVNRAVIRQNLLIRVGEPYDNDKESKDIKMIFDRFNLRALFIVTEMEGGLLVIIRLDEGLRIREFAFRGVSSGEEDDLREKLGIDVEDVPNQYLLRSTASKIRDHFREKGYYFAEVNTIVEPMEDGIRLVFEVFKGEEVDVERIRFIGLKEVDEDDLKDFMEIGEPSAWNFKWLFPDKLKSNLLETDIFRLNQYLKQEGYLDARVSLDSLRFNDDFDEVEISILVQEGQRYYIRSVDVSGCRAFFPGQIRELIHIEPGEPYRDVRITRVIRTIESFYGDRGYIRARMLDPELRYDEKLPLVDLVFKVDEGIQKTLRDVIISGNRVTQDKVIRREITLYPGEIISDRERRWSYSELQQLQYFADEAGGPGIDMILRPTADPQLEDLYVDVIEGPTGNFLFSVAASSDVGLVGGISVRKRNFDIGDPPSSPWALPGEFFSNEAFHGGGQNLTLSLMPGTNEASYSLSFEEPYLFDTQPYPVSFNFNAFRSYRYYSDYNIRRVGFNPVLGKRWSRNLSTSLGVRSERVREYDLDNNPPDILVEWYGKTGIRGLTSRISYQDLDRGFLPTSGYSTSLNYEYLGGFLGSEVDLTKAVWNGTVYIPAYETEAGLKHVLTLKTAFGWEEEHSGMDSTPIFERFFAGGISGYFPCKGFRWRGIGPRENDVPLGGKVGVALSAEYSIPLVSDYQREYDAEVSRVKGVFFVDAANVGTDIHDDDLFDKLRSSYGVGVKIHLPVLGGFPIALYYGIPWKKYGGDERRSFNINMSTVF